jgi:hypothetical protein
MSTAETTNVLATAEIEPTVGSNKEVQATENATKTCDVPDTSISASSAEPSDVPAVEDSSKSSPADNTKVDEDGSKEMKTSSIENENAETITTSPAKDEVNETVNKGTH